MFTTRDIPSMVDPGDGSVLPARIFIPDPVAFPPPWPVYCATHSPGFKYDTIDSLARVFAGDIDGPSAALVNYGILCVSFNVRGCLALGPGAQGQTSSGAWHQQTDDFKAGILMLRQGAWIELVQGFQVTGYVGGIGPSGGGHHAIYCALSGTLGLDKLDAGVPLSAPLDFGDRAGDTGNNSHFIQVIEGYCETTDTVQQTLKAPISLDLALASALHITNGDNENQPTHQALNFDAAIQALPGGPPAGYSFRILTGDGGMRHAYAEWPFIFEETIQWIRDRIAEWSGTPPPPPPDPTGRVLVTAAISNLSPGLPYTLNVRAKDRTIPPPNEGPNTPFDFISDRADTGGQGKAAPQGVYTLVDAVDGVITGDISTRDWLGFSYVDGAVLPTNWKALNGASRSSFDWSQTDAFLAACGDNSKQAGFAVEMGIKNPLWIYSGSHAVGGVFVNGPNSGTIPIPWDANWLQVAKGFIRELATRYDPNLALSYVVVGGLGQLLETLLVQQPADYNNLNALAVNAGYPDLITAWSATSAALLDVWAKSFRATPVYLAIELPVPSINGGLTGIDEFVRSSITRYRSRFGIMTLQLDGLTAAGPDLSLNKIIQNATGQSPTAYRFRRVSTDPACDPSQDPGSYDPELGLQNAANAGIDIGVQMEEFYEADILTVTDNYPTHFADFQTDLIANAV